MVKLSCRRQWSHYLYLGDDLPHHWNGIDRISQEVLTARLEESQQIGRHHQAIITQLAIMLYNCPDCCSKLGQTAASLEDKTSTSDSDPQEDNLMVNLIPSPQMTSNLKQLLNRHSLTIGTHLRDTNTMPSRWTPFDPKFDQYWNGPTLECMHPITDAGEMWSASRNTWISELGSAMLYRDYGYRILPSFSQMFWLGPPMNALDYMMSIGVSDAYDPSWQQAPIQKHNHIYVDVLIPQSAEDQGPDGTQRQEWWTKSIPLSSIPHVPFVVLPSISQESSNSSLPYVDTTVHEIRYKSRKGGSGQPGSQRSKATPVSRTAFERIQNSMKTRVRDQAMLAPYGSFFFVLEGKGIKLWTKDGQDGRYNSPYEALKTNFANLDWDYIMDRKHGELYLDLGISFNPTGRYGGIQAEMMLANARSSQICFRSAYHLSYEAIRPNNNQPKFISDRDAYHFTEAYLKECRWMHEIYSGGPSQRAYECRDEYRMSGQAALEVLPYLKKQSLQSLDVERIWDRHGMLFLYNMEEYIMKEDNAEVLKIMGANIKSHPKIHPPSNHITSSDNWPIGPQPSWKDVVETVEDRPQVLMRPWIYDSIWDPGDLNIGLLFIQFTREFWLQLGGTQTTDEFMDAITDSAPPQSSKWKIYWTQGYIASYHEMCSKLSEAQLQHLHDRLDILFANLQCLPDANKPTQKSPGSTWTLASGQDSIKIVTNPNFYLIQKIGGRKRTRVDRRSTKAKHARKPPTRQIKQSVISQKIPLPHDTAASKPCPSTKDRNSSKKKQTEDDSVSETNSMSDSNDNDLTNDESEIDSLFDDDRSGEEADEEHNDSDKRV
ncbi:hypothetical protein BDR07DRAFT_1382600 [Suillus spraguei]|nr:hypothetical protein BDR07DRAFT_1382600 [Suillus spraguei]